MVILDNPGDDSMAKAVERQSAGPGWAWGAAVTGGATRLRPASDVYAVGTTNSVSSVPKVMPPTITQPICIRDSAPAPDATASGTEPSTMAPVVIRIGRSRNVAASMTASNS